MEKEVLKFAYGKKPKNHWIMEKPSKKDIIYAAGKAALGSIPLAGAVASELLGLIIASPLEKRRDKLMNELGERLKILENDNNINLEELRQDDQFIDIVLQATSLALKTSEDEKIEAFKNAIINTAAGEAPDKIKSQIFLNCIDSFTSWHIKILNILDNPAAWYKQHEKAPPRMLMGPLRAVITSAYPELREEEEMINLVWSDLHRAGFHRTSDLGTNMSGDGIMASRTTNLGKEFLEFIQKH